MYGVWVGSELRPAKAGCQRFFLRDRGGSIMYADLVGVRMPTCQNCGSFVTADYVRVFTPNDVDRPRVCPACEDLVRDGADVREARATRSS